ncbi:unnamed protein product [Heterobilharzia americana]|nr:unnamed protein product [Heterobilharzia americana]
MPIRRITLFYLIALNLFLLKECYSTEEILKRENYLNLCSQCNQTITTTLNEVLNLSFQLKWERKFLNGCEYTGPFRDYCASFFSSTMFKLINKFMANIKPEQFCQNIFLCSS